MESPEKRASFEDKMDLTNMTMENEKYIAMREVCDTPDSVEALTSSSREEEESLEDIYNKILKNARITLITPLKEFKQKVQKLEYKCNKCGTTAFSRFDLLLPLSSKLNDCKTCRKMERKLESETRLWIKIGEILKKRGGKIVEHKPNGEYWTRESKIRVECTHGHRWNTKFKHILNNHWCRICARDPDNQIEKIKSVDIRRISGANRYYIFTRLVDRCGMRMYFWTPGRKYYMVCKDCGEAALLSEAQITTRKYLCSNRCQKALQMSFSRFFMSFGESMDRLERNKETVKAIYIEGRENYKKYKAKQFEMPIPKLATRRSKRWE